MADYPQLRDDLTITPLRDGGGAPYTIEDPVSGESFELGEQEYFLLRRMDGRHSLEQLAKAFQTAFGEELSEEAIAGFVRRVRVWGLLVGSESLVLAMSGAIDEEPAAPAPDGPTAPTTPGGPGRDAWRPDWAVRAASLRYTRLFRAEGLFNGLSRLGLLLQPLSRLFLPLLFAAFFTAWFHAPALIADLARVRAPMSLLQHLLFGLLTVNLVSRLAMGASCRTAGGSVPGFGLVWVLGFLPRFHAELDGWSEIPRERVCRVVASPLLTRLVLLASGILVWYITRGSGNGLGTFALMVAAVAAVSLVISANPLGRGDGYTLLTCLLGETQLRGQAFRQLFAPLLPTQSRPPPTDEPRAAALKLYAWAVIVYLAALFALVAYLAGGWLTSHWGGTGAALFVGAIALMALRFAKALSRLRAGRSRAAQPGRPRRRQAAAAPGKEEPASAGSAATWVVLLLLFATGMVIPYQYETGGPLELLPTQQRELNVEVPGVVEAVHVASGEWLAAGSTIATVAAYRQVHDVAATDASIERQRARLGQLQTTPRDEEVELAKKQLEAAAVSERYLRDKLTREAELFAKGHISVEQFETSKKQLAVAEQETLERQAALDLVREGPHPEEVNAARAELKRLEGERVYYGERLARTHLVTPIDGRVAFLQLEDLVGRYLDEGDPVTTVVNDRVLRAYIEVPETDIGEVRAGSKARIKLWAHPGRILAGDVTDIEPVAVERDFGRIIRVAVDLPNDGALVAGMTGYGKIHLREEPLLVAFTHRLVRFFLVEMWSWLP